MTSTQYTLWLFSVKVQKLSVQLQKGGGNIHAWHSFEETSFPSPSTGYDSSPSCTAKTLYTKIRNKYSQKWNCAASFPISTFMFLRYSHDRSSILVQKIGGPIVGIYKSLTNTWMWKFGIHKSDLLCSVTVFAALVLNPVHGCTWCDAVSGSNRQCSSTCEHTSTKPSAKLKRTWHGPVI